MKVFGWDRLSIFGRFAKQNLRAARETMCTDKIAQKSVATMIMMVIFQFGVKNKKLYAARIVNFSQYTIITISHRPAFDFISVLNSFPVNTQNRLI